MHASALTPARARALKRLTTGDWNMKRTYLVKIKCMGYYSTYVEAVDEAAAEADALRRYQDGFCHVDDEDAPEVIGITEHVSK
jgi:hypothetical protein